MTPPTPQLDYAHSRSRGPSLVWRRLLVVACCLGVSWLVWLVVGFVTYDPFDDSLPGWLVFMLAMPGTMSGLIVAVACLVVMPPHRRARRRWDAGASRGPRSSA